MFPLLTGLISGGASLLGSMFSSDTSAQNTQAQIAAQQQMQGQSEQFNAQQAQLNRDFQSQMSNTAYQRASADMQKAGLNPASMFGSGSAASSPGGATASVGTPSVPMPQTTSKLAGLGHAVDNVVSSAIAAKTYDKMTTEIANMQTQQAKTEADTGVSKAMERLVGSKADSAGFNVTAAQAEAERAKRYIDMPQWLKNSVEYTKYGSSGVSSVGDAISSFVPTARVAQGFQALRDSKKFKDANFVGKYGVPVDEYLSDN